MRKFLLCFWINCAKLHLLLKSRKYSKVNITFICLYHHHHFHDCKTFTTQTFTTPDVHHLRRSPPKTFTTSDIHHPQCKIRRSPPQTFTTPDVHHLRRSPPQTFTTPFVKSDVHHPRHSPPQTFTTPYSKMLHSPPTNIHHQPTSPSPTMITPKRKIRQPCTRAVECSCYLQVIELFLIIFV